MAGLDPAMRAFFLHHPLDGRLVAGHEEERRQRREGV